MEHVERIKSLEDKNKPKTVRDKIKGDTFSKNVFKFLFQYIVSGSTTDYKHYLQLPHEIITHVELPLILLLGTSCPRVGVRVWVAV